MESIQQIFDDNIFNFFKSYPKEIKKVKVFKHIIGCRNGNKAFLTTCPNCGHQSYGLTNCGDRHCPVCSSRKNELFITKEKSKLLPVNYYHITFTVPHQVNDLFYHNQELLYNILFKSSIGALKEVLSNDKYMGADKIGVTAILHTWGSNLCYHPHLHTCLAGVGLDNKGNVVKPKNESYIFPAAVIQKIFKSIFLKELNENIDKLNTSFDDLFFMKDFLIELSKKEFIVNIRDTMTNPNSVINYFARYANRVCISKSKIVDYDRENNNVTFKYKDYKDNSKIKEMTLNSLDFMRRFSLHILPDRFRKIRSYVFLAPADDKLLLLLANKLHTKLSIIKLRKLPILCKYCSTEVNLILVSVDDIHQIINDNIQTFKEGRDSYEKLIL